MRLKGKIKKKDQSETDGFAEIVNISITGEIASYGVHLYYYELGKQVYQPIDGALTKRYDFPLDNGIELFKKDEIYLYGYKKLQGIPKFKDFVIVE